MQRIAQHFFKKKCASGTVLMPSKESQHSLSMCHLGGDPHIEIVLCRHRSQVVFMQLARPKKSVTSTIPYRTPQRKRSCIMMMMGIFLEYAQHERFRSSSTLDDHKDVTSERVFAIVAVLLLS